MRNNRHIAVEGRLVSERVSSVVQAIREYSPELDVEWCPPESRTPGQSAFKIIHRPVGSPPYVIFHVKTEEEFTSNILRKIIMGDQRNGEVLMSDFEAAEEASRRVAHQRWLDEMEEAHDLARSLIRSNKDTYKVNKNLIFKEGRLGNQAIKSTIIS